MRYAIADTHGCNKTLLALLHTINPTSTDTVIFLGDYIDRGPDSKGVIDTILELSTKCLVVTLRGNHEQFLLTSMETESSYIIDGWKSNGGVAAIKSLGLEDATGKLDFKRLDEKYFNFFLNTYLKYVTEDFIFCHGGLNFSLANPLEDSTEDDILWTREYGIDESKLKGKTLVVGHTPVTREEIKEKAQTNYVMLDNGCVYGNMRYGGKYGMLTAFCLETRQLYFQIHLDY